MDTTELVNLIGSLGFPVAMCLYMLKTQNDQNKSMNKIISSFQRTVDNNTSVTQDTNELVKECLNILRNR